MATIINHRFKAADIAARLESARADADRLRGLLRGNEHHAYYTPIHSALQIAEQRIDALMLALSEG